MVPSSNPKNALGFTSKGLHHWGKPFMDSSNGKRTSSNQRDLMIMHANQCKSAPRMFESSWIILNAYPQMQFRFSISGWYHAWFPHGPPKLDDFSGFSSGFSAASLAAFRVTSSTMELTGKRWQKQNNTPLILNGWSWSIDPPQKSKRFLKHDWIPQKKCDIPRGDPSEQFLNYKRWEISHLFGSWCSC